MAKDPAFLFYSQDFFTGVSTMSFEDRGKFITVLCVMHQKGRLTEETIRFLVGSISDNLSVKFRIDEKGLWFNKRLEEEIEKRLKFTESRRENGNLGGRPPKKNLPETDRLSKTKPMYILMEDENKNEVDNKLNKERLKKFEEDLNQVAIGRQKSKKAAFLKYWTEPDENGVMRFEAEKFWDMKVRLERFKVNEPEETSLRVREQI